MHLLHDLSIHCFEVKIKALTPFQIPQFPGSMLRGTFGVALKRTVCVNLDKNCSSCLTKVNCIYKFLFEPESNIPRIKNPPHPFITYPISLGEKKMRRGSTYTFGFTVFGEAINKLPYIIYSIIQMGRLGMGKGKGNFEVREIKKFISPKKKTTIYTQKDGKLKSAPSLKASTILKSKFSKNTLTLETLTPIRMKIRGKLTDKISLRDIIVSISRRFMGLTGLYGDGEVNLVDGVDLDELLKNVESETSFKWVDFKRFSKRQDTYMQMGGAMGKMVIKGELSRIYPILKLGEFIHIGKNTSFGLGRYKLLDSNHND